MRTFVLLAGLGATAVAGSVLAADASTAGKAAPAVTLRLAAAGATTKAAAKDNCPSHDAGLKLAPGFCASIFADKIGHARHMAVSADGVVYVNTWSGRYYASDKSPPVGGFLVALQDKNGDGKAEVVERFGETVATGGAGGTGIALYKGSVYAEINDRIVRYALAAGSIVPKGVAEVVVSGLPLEGDHPMHPFAIDADGNLFVDVASATNACQQTNRTPKSPGLKPCTELQTRGGIWRYDANKTGQKFSSAERYATGIRNADGITIDPSGHTLYSTQHGRDQLAENWPDLYVPEQSATLPAEELLQIRKGGDYGWPECYYDPGQRKLVLAPEYGGNGGKEVGECAGKIAPIAAFPAHWAPDGLVIYGGKQFPERYHNGAFIAFHGSWNRAPFAQGGYNLVFQPLADGKSAGACQIFGDGFAAGHKDPASAPHRPTGLAVGPDGALYVSDDVAGRVYRITYVGGESAAAKPTMCPRADAPAGKKLAVAALPPEGLKKEAGTAALPVPPGSSKEAVALGDQIYHAQVGSATCTGCHGADGSGTPLGPNLAAGKWLWSDGSVGGIKKTISEGVAKPKAYRAPMPANGGAQLTSDQLSAVAAYVWAISHH